MVTWFLGKLEDQRLLTLGILEKETSSQGGCGGLWGGFAGGCGGDTPQAKDHQKPGCLHQFPKKRRAKNTKGKQSEKQSFRLPVGPDHENFGG